MNAALAPETGALHFKYKTVTLRGLLARFLKRYRMQANTNTRSNPMACEEAGTTYSPIIVWTRKNDTDGCFTQWEYPSTPMAFSLCGHRSSSPSPAVLSLFGPPFAPATMDPAGTPPLPLGVRPAVPTALPTARLSRT